MKKKVLKKIAVIITGNMLYSLAVALFVLPCGLITGGTTGIGLTVKYLFDTDIAGFIGVFNIAMFILGALILGKSFALTTIVSTVCYPCVLKIFQSVIGDYVITKDLMLATVFAGIMIGTGIGMVIRAGASTGGMDIPPLLLNKKFGIPVSVLLYVFDFAILLMQMIFSNIEQTLYGILMVLIYTVVLDKVLVNGKTMMQVKIISEKHEEINALIHDRLDRGTTYIRSEGGYLRKESNLVLVVLSNRELAKLSELVMDMDPEAFMIINNVNEVKGRGFTIGRKYLDFNK